MTFSCRSTVIRNYLILWLELELWLKYPPGPPQTRVRFNVGLGLELRTGLVLF